MEQLSTHLQAWAAALGPINEAILRLVFSAIAGALVGLEREVHGRQAGFRTNTLVCLGCCLAMLVSIHFAFYAWPTHAAGASINTNVDPARVAYSVMTGIGFVGAGTIIRHRGSVRGLTTAAGMWCVAAIGLAIGLGMYVVATMAVILVMLVLGVLEYVQQWVPKVHYRTVTVRRQWTQGCIAETIRRFRDAGFRVSDVSFHRTPDLAAADVSLQIAFVNPQQYFSFEDQLEGDRTYELLGASDG